MSYSRENRIPASKETAIKVNMKDATLNADQDYAFSLAKPIENARAIQLLSFNIDWSWPNIYASTNTLIFKEGVGANITITLPIGNYYDTDIISELSTLMTSAGTQTYTVTENEIASTFIITGSTKSFTLIYAGSTLATTIGLTANLTSTLSGSVYIANLQNSWNLLPSKELDISLPNLVTMYNTDGSNNSILGTVSLSGYQFSDTIRENMSGVELALNQKSFSKFVVSITDQTSYTPNFDPNGLITLVLRILYY